MNEKQQQLTFDKGITNVPSDALCSDNALDESLGLVYDNGEHRVIQKPVVKKPVVKFSSFTDKILSVHKFNDDERFIGQNDTTIKWYDKNGDGGTVLLSPSGNVQVTSIGKTLIVSDGNGLHYFLWKGNGYESLGALPEPEFCFWLDGANISDLWVVNRGKSNEMVERTEVASTPWRMYDYKVVEGKQEDWNNLVVGLYAKNKKQIAQKKGFCLPFFVRTALELYDGSYTHISNPILLFPCVTSNSTTAEAGWELSMVTHYLKLMFTQTVALEKWNDIVKDVVIFASPGIEVYDLIVDQQAVDYENGTEKLSYFDYVKGYVYRTQQVTLPEEVIHHGIRPNLANLYTFINKPVSEINEAIKGTSVFYKLCSIGLKPVSNKDVAEFIDTHTLENLTTQEFLKEDDYFSRSSLIARLIYAYNSRLNLAGVKRSIFEGFKFFTPFSSAYAYNANVYIETDSGNKLATQTLAGNNGANLYFFYPDSRARAVTMNNQTYSLTEHPALNGAYYFAGIEKVTSSWSQPTGDGSALQNSDSNPEILDNYIMTSEVNNPFLFKAEGYNRVGTGEVIGMSTLTQALSEGQFGQYPLLVFSESGIYAMSLSSTGTFNAVHPFSREVALKDNPCITQTDGAVFFASKKGLMVIVGSQVTCVSEQLSGKTNTFMVGGTEQTIDLGDFATFLETAVIAYDYRDSLLWIFDKSHTACWIYSIKSKAFGKFEFTNDDVIDNVVNYYPDYLLQRTGGRVYSLLDRPNINTDPDTYSGTIITRPMKLENALALKSILQVRHVKQFGGGQNELRLRIFASNNLESWCELHSLGGMPWKYYRFRYDFHNLIATDRFSGTMLITQERRTNKLK